jgi:AcrR family transcriptional regulator
MPRKKTEDQTSQKREQVIVAANVVFLRYGRIRTTMNDIATEAGISRPALYLMFPQKDEIFALVIDRLLDEKLTQWREALPKMRSLDRKLHHCCEQWAGEGYDLTKAHPDARDMFDLSIPPVRAMYKRLENFLVELIRPGLAGSKLKTDPEELASILIFGMRGFKDIARDATHMRSLIALQVEVVLMGMKAR